MKDDARVDFSRTLLDPDFPCPGTLRTWNGSDPTPRLAIYRNSVVSGLINALAEEFPVTQALVGEEFFRAMASIHVRTHPPRTRILAHYGRDFPEFIATFGPAHCVPYLPDVARLEVARVNAAHAADSETATPATVQAALEQPESLAELQIAFHPSVSFLSSPFAVVSIWLKHQTDTEVDLGNLDTDTPEDAMVVRRELEVAVVPIPSGTVRFADSLMRGGSLGASAQAALATCATFDLPQTLGILFRRGAITAIGSPTARHA